MTPAQRAALAHVELVAAETRTQARQRLEGVSDAAKLVDQIVRHGRVTLNFHPDRLLANGRTVAESLAADGVYRGQFETGISNGSRSAHPGGSRFAWRERFSATHTPVGPPESGRNTAHSTCSTTPMGRRRDSARAMCGCGRSSTNAARLQLAIRIWGRLTWVPI